MQVQDGHSAIFLLDMKFVLFLACTVLRYPKDAQVGCVGSYWTRLEFPRNETTRENFIC